MILAKPLPNRRSEARCRVVNEEGDLYAARTTDGLWIKIGFSLQVKDRIRALNWEYANRVVFELAATTRSRLRTEQQLHRVMQPLHQVHIGAGKEFYPAIPAVNEIVKELIELPDSLDIDSKYHMQLWRWCREAAGEDHNRLPALDAHSEIVERNEAALQRIYARTRALIEAREAARASA